jgi:hypothetical protein
MPQECNFLQNVVPSLDSDFSDTVISRELLKFFLVGRVEGKRVLN